MSQQPWDEKRGDIRRFSLLRLTTDSVLSPPPKLTGWSAETWCAQWDERRIELRTMYLTSLALKHWTRPVELGASDEE